MTVETQINKVRYLGNGAARVFPVPFPVWKPEHLSLYVWEKRQTELTSGYAVVGAEPGSKSVSVTLDQPLAKGLTLTILRHVPYTQPMDLANGGAFSADTLEGSDDNLEMQIQQIAETLDRALLAPEGSPEGAISYEDLLDLRDRAQEAADRAEAAADTRGIASGVYNVRKPWIAKTAVASGGVLTMPGYYYPTRDVLMLWYQGAICSPRSVSVEAAGAYQYEEIGTNRNVLSNQVLVYFPIAAGDLLDMYVVSSAAGRNLEELEAAVAEAGVSRDSAAASATAAGAAKTQAQASAAAAKVSETVARDAVAEIASSATGTRNRLANVELSADNSQAYIWIEAIDSTRLTVAALKRAMADYRDDLRQAATEKSIDAADKRADGIRADMADGLWINAINATRLTGSGVKRSMELYKLGGY